MESNENSFQLQSVRCTGVRPEIDLENIALDGFVSVSQKSKLGRKLLKEMGDGSHFGSNPPKELTKEIQEQRENPRVEIGAV
jgi:hypothetical protein